MRVPPGVLPLVLVSIAAQSAPAQTELIDELIFEPVVSGVSFVTAIENAGDGSGRLFVAERQGLIRAVDSGALLPAPFLDIRGRVRSGGERGLLGLAFHPSYPASPYFFVNYTGSRGETIVSRFRAGLGPNTADPASEEVLLTFEQPFPNHNGGDLAFGPDGYLYIATGDGGSGGDPQNNAQNLTNLLGKILRVDAGSGPPVRIPPDNPFASQPGARGEIWAYGLRNPWRISFDRLTGDLFIADVGQNRREEVSFQPAGSAGGENYGWRLMEGTSCFNPPAGCKDGSLVLPILEYAHAPGSGASVTGGFRYRGAAHPRLAGAYLFADFVTGGLFLGVEQNGGWSIAGTRSTPYSISTFGEDEAGEIYFADFGAAGTLYRVAAPPEPPQITQGGAVNTASYNAGPGAAPGSLLSIFGTGLANAVESAGDFPLPALLAGTRVHVNGVPAPLLFASPGQLNIQIPWEAEGLSAAEIAISVEGGGDSAPMTMAIARAQPGIFALDGDPGGQAAALIGGTGLLAAPTIEHRGARPARRGETIEIFCTGLGPVSETPATGAPAASDAATLEQPLVTAGETPMRVVYSGLAPGFAGLYQVNFELGSDAPSGARVPVQIAVGETSSNAPSIAVE